MRTFYEVSTTEEEDRRRRRGRGDNVEDDIRPQGEGTRRCLLWMTLRSTSVGPFRRCSREQSTCYSADFLRREIKHDPQSIGRRGHLSKEIERVRASVVVGTGVSSTKLLVTNFIAHYQYDSDQ
jgi:hypothetical protein